MIESDSAMFKWIIPKYRTQNYTECNESKCFTMAKNKDLTFCSKLQPIDLYDYVQIELIFKKNRTGKTDTSNWKMLTMSVSCLNALNQKVFTHTKTCSKLGYDSYKMLTIQKCLLQQHLKDVNADLILLYEIKLYAQSPTENIPLIEEDDNFIIDKDFRDVNLLIGGKTIRAHKCILASRSPVFSVMFASYMKESINNEVKITDFDYDVFIEVLRFMYTGKIEKVQLAFEILKAAHFYQINDLMIICEHVLPKNLNFENVLEIFKLADEYDLIILRNNCVIFIIQHFKSFEVLSELEDLTKTHPHLIMQLMKSLYIA